MGTLGALCRGAVGQGSGHNVRQMGLQPQQQVWQQWQQILPQALHQTAQQVAGPHAHHLHTMPVPAVNILWSCKSRMIMAFEEDQEM